MAASSNSNSNPTRWITLAVIAVVVLLLLLRIPVLARYLLVVAGLVLLVALPYALIHWFRMRRIRQAEANFRRSREGRLQEKLEECAGLMERNEREMEEIRHSMRELRTKLQLPNLSEKQQEESRSLLAAFQSELDLRQTKARFFQTCRSKLVTLQQHFAMEQELKDKKAVLRRLRENSYEDLAQYEGIKTEVELNTFHLETIDQLSSRMIASTSVDDAEHLQLELEEMTRELER